MVISRGFRDLIVYKKSYAITMKIYEITKSFPKEEKYSLIDQIRRSSRSIPTNIAEAWAKNLSKSFCQQTHRFTWRRA